MGLDPNFRSFFPSLVFKQFDEIFANSSHVVFFGEFHHVCLQFCIRREIQKSAVIRGLMILGYESNLKYALELESIRFWDQSFFFSVFASFFNVWFSNLPQQTNSSNWFEPRRSRRRGIIRWMTTRRYRSHKHWPCQNVIGSERKVLANKKMTHSCKFKFTRGVQKFNY